MDPSTLEVQQYAAQVATEKGLPVSVFLSLLNQESGFNQNAHGSSGEIGISQLMPATAASLGVNPNDWKQNIQGGASYLASLLDKANGNIPLAIAGYNAGPGVIAGTKAIPSSTQNYVDSILKNTSSFGQDLKDFLNSNPLDQLGSIANGISPGSGDWAHAISNFFSINTGVRIAAVVIGVILIGAAVWQLVSGTKIVKGVVSTVKTAALAAA